MFRLSFFDLITAKTIFKKATASIVCLGWVGLGCAEVSFLILGASYNNTTFSQKDIAEAFFIDRTTMVNLVDELESRGLVERVRHSEDRRQYRIILTVDGEVLFKQAQQIAYQVEDEYLSVLSDKQKEDLRGSLLLVLNDQNEKKNTPESDDAGACWVGVNTKVKDIKAKIKKQ